MLTSAYALQPSIHSILCAFAVAVVVLHKIAAAIPQPQEPHLHEDHCPFTNVASDEPEGKTEIATALAKELILISVLTWGGEHTGPQCHSTRKDLGLGTFTGLRRPPSFRTSRGLLPRHNQSKFHYRSFQTCNGPMVLFSPRLKNKNASLKYLLKIKTKIRAFKHVRTLKTIFTV